MLRSRVHWSVLLKSFASMASELCSLSDIDVKFYFPLGYIAFENDLWHNAPSKSAVG